MTANTETAMFENLEHNFGVGNGKTTACVNSLAYLIYADQQGTSREEALATLTDNVSCICPVISRLSIRINDRRAFWPDHDEATRWMHETAPRLLGTAHSVDIMRMRKLAFLCADAAVREIAPVWVDLAADNWPEAKRWAEQLRACEPVTDTRTALAAQKVAKKVALEARKYAHAYAAAAAAADAAAAAGADAGADAAAAGADAAVDADAYAYAYAYEYATSAAAAAAAAAAAKILKPIMLGLLDRCLAVTE